MPGCAGFTPASVEAGVPVQVPFVKNMNETRPVGCTPPALLPALNTSCTLTGPVTVWPVMSAPPLSLITLVEIQSLFAFALFP